MHHWNYRVVKRVYPMPEWTGEGTVVMFGIHEVHYDSADDSHVVSVSDRPATVDCEDLSAIPDILQRMTEAVRKPVVDFPVR